MGPGARYTLHPEPTLKRSWRMPTPPPRCSLFGEYGVGHGSNVRDLARRAAAAFLNTNAISTRESQARERRAKARTLAVWLKLVKLSWRRVGSSRELTGAFSFATVPGHWNGP